LVYGKPINNPVNESHPLRPESIYAIHKLTAEYYYLLYHRLYGIKCTIFRISNPFGPYQRFGSNNYGILNWFIHKAINREVIEIYGDGSQKRDFIYIDDIIDLLTQAMYSSELYGGVFNVGSGVGVSLLEAAKIILKYLPEGKLELKAWPLMDKKIETGDYISDISALNKAIGWNPRTSLEIGISDTIEFYGRKKG
jgi:nucleoside-diphosphate-sugar epimerase